MVFLKDYKNISAKKYGNKAFNLSFCFKNGFNVPNAFFISNVDLIGYKSSTRHTPPRFARNPSSEGNFSKEILKNFDKLNCHTVSVRSRANAEDSKKQSFAGQFLTVLDVQKNDLLKSISKVVNSTNADYVKHYSGNKNLKMNVIVQKMLQPDYSGVIFTKNPVNNNINEIVVEMVKGNAEKLVSGKVQPLTFVLNKKTDNAKIQYLNLIYSNALMLEKLYGKELDIEFVVKDNVFWVLQVREITT